MAEMCWEQKWKFPLEALDVNFSLSGARGSPDQLGKFERSRVWGCASRSWLELLVQPHSING